MAQSILTFVIQNTWTQLYGADHFVIRFLSRELAYPTQVATSSYRQYRSGAPVDDQGSNWDGWVRLLRLPKTKPPQNRRRRPRAPRAAPAGPDRHRAPGGQPRPGRRCPHPRCGRSDRERRARTTHTAVQPNGSELEGALIGLAAQLELGAERDAGGSFRPGRRAKRVS